jgi:hypothetical protein
MSLKSSQMAFLLEAGLPREGLAGLLRGCLRRAAAARTRGRRRAGEAHGAVHGLVAHGHGELHAEAADEVLLLVAVEDDGVDEAHGGLAGIEVEPHGEGQPFAPAGCAFMKAVDFHHSANRAVLLKRHRLDAAEIFLASRGIFGIRLGTVLQNADELAVLGDGVAVDRHPIDEVGPGFGNRASQRAGIDLNVACIVSGNGWSSGVCR